jgi:hypothetical protein
MFRSRNYGIKHTDPISTILAVCSTHLILLDLIILTMLNVKFLKVKFPPLPIFIHPVSKH